MGKGRGKVKKEGGLRRANEGMWIEGAGSDDNNLRWRSLLDHKEV